MNSPRALLAFGFCLALTLPAISAENPKSEKEKLSVVSQALLKLDKLRKDIEQLDLSAEQKEQLAKLREEWGPKMKELLEKVRDLLTEEQRAAAEDAMKKAREVGKQMRESFLAIESTLTLSEEQRKKLDEVGAELQKLQKEAVKRIMEVLTPEQREKVKPKSTGDKQKDKT